MEGDRLTATEASPPAADREQADTFSCPPGESHLNGPGEAVQTAHDRQPRGVFVHTRRAEPCRRSQ